MIPWYVAIGILFVKCSIQFHSDAIVLLLANVGYDPLACQGVSTKQHFLGPVCHVQVFGFLRRNLVPCMIFIMNELLIYVAGRLEIYKRNPKPEISGLE